MTCLLPSYDPMEHTNMFAKAGLDIFIIVFLFLCILFTNITDFCLHFSESEESDEEDGTGNVTRLVMRPPGHSGKAKKGHLCLDASFETGIFLLKCFEILF